MRKKKRVSLALKIFVVLFSVYASVQIIRLEVKISEQKKEQSELVEQRNELKTQNARLRDIADSEEDEEYIEALARDQLDYVFSGEQTFENTANK